MYTKQSCCVAGCKNQNTGPDSGVIFYHFPEEKLLRDKWVEACAKNGVTKDKNWAPNLDSVICNVHFVSGQKNPNDWHPDYVPSVFRSLRRNITKAKGKHLDDSDDESVSRGRPKSVVKRESLSTPTRNTPKNKDAGFGGAATAKKSVKLSVGRPKKVVVLKEEVIQTQSLGRPKKILDIREERSGTPVSIGKPKKIDTESDESNIISESFYSGSNLGRPKKLDMSSRGGGTPGGNLGRPKKVSNNVGRPRKNLDKAASGVSLGRPKKNDFSRAPLGRPKKVIKNDELNYSGVKYGRPKKKKVVEEEEDEEEEFKYEYEYEEPYEEEEEDDGRASLNYGGRPRKNFDVKKEDEAALRYVSDILEADSPSKLSLYEDYDLQLSEAGRPVRNKRKRLGDDFIDESPGGGPVLKTLSVVLERTSDKKIKLSTGEITIKEEPMSETDYVMSPGSDDNMSIGNKKHCKKCSSLELRLRKLEDSIMSNASVDRCKRCPVTESKLKKAEDELDQIIDGKVGKCHRCAGLEQKCKRMENNMRKSQSEVAKLQSRLSSIELNEETFKKYKNKVKMYTGFPNFEALMLVFEHLEPHLPVDAVKFLSPFQMFVIVLMRLKLNFPFWDLTYRFGSSPNHIQSFYPQYISVLEAQLSHVVLWPKANLLYRLEVLASNLKQSFGIIVDGVEVNTLIVANDGNLSEEDKIVRVCAALYHISQLVSSNHSQQLMRILKSKDDTDRNLLMKAKNSEAENRELNNEKESEEKDAMSTAEESQKKAVDAPSKQEEAMVNGEEEEEEEEEEEDVDDSDIFFEDLTKDIKLGVNSNDSLKLECTHLWKELENLNQKLTLQFRFYTGMRNFEVFNNLLGFLQTHVTHISKEKLSYFQQLHLVLIRLKLNLEVQDLSYIFNVDPDHVVYLTRLWLAVIVLKLSRYIDWPAGVEDSDGEKRLLGTVKLKYQILWNPLCAPRNKETGRERERFDSKQLLRACAALYNIDDIEVFKDGRKESKTFQQNHSLENKSNEELEQMCRDLRTELYDLRKSIMSSIASCYTEENFQNNDHMVQFYTGFPNYEMLMNVFTLIVPVTKGETRKAVPPFQQFLILLLRMKLNLATQDLGFRFGMGHSNTHKFIQDWLVLLHSQLAPYITWPDDDEDVEVFTDMLRKTYAYLRNNISPRRKDHERKSETGIYDIATLVCAGLYNVGEVSFCEQSDSEFESFDEEW